MKGKKDVAEIDPGLYTQGQMIAEVNRVAEVIAEACGADFAEAAELLEKEADDFRKTRNALEKGACELVERAKLKFDSAVSRARAERDERCEEAAHLRQQADAAETEMCRRLDILDLLRLENTPKSD